MRPRGRPGRDLRPAQAGVHGRRRRAREVRGVAGLHPRLPGARRRLRRTAIPGIPGWGAVSAAAVLRRYPHLEDIPDSVRMWDVSVRGAATLAAALREQRDEAFLYRELAPLRMDAPIPQRSLDELRWRGVPRAPFEALVERLAAPSLLAACRAGPTDGGSGVAVAARGDRRCQASCHTHDLR